MIVICIVFLLVRLVNMKKKKSARDKNYTIYYLSIYKERLNMCI